MRRWAIPLAALAIAMLVSANAGAQNATSAAANDSAAGAPSAPAAAPRPDSAAAVAMPRSRASWTGDRMPMRVGDLLTVVVDEQTAARERVTRTSSDSRGLNAKLNADLGSSDPMRYAISSGLDQGSRDVGEANRQGDLTAVLTVRVTAIEANGVAHIEGARKVNVDGREQSLTLTGVVRSEDVMPSHFVLSSRIGEAIIDYKGKKIGPRTGIIGKFLGMLWP